MLNIDAQLHNADWTKTEWNLPPYKSDRFMMLLEEADLTLDDFKELPVYEHALEEGLIEDDEWVGKSKNTNVADKVFKGGPGSGNWQHGGRSGVWGGSSSTGGASEEFLAHPEELRHSFDIETGEFNPARHQKYLDTLDVQEAQDYVEEFEEYVDAEEIEDTMTVDDLSGEEIYELIPTQYQDSYNPETGEFDEDKHWEKLADIEGVSVEEVKVNAAEMALGMEAQDYDFEVMEFEQMEKDEYLEEQVKSMIDEETPPDRTSWDENTSYEDIPRELQASFDPETGEFDEDRHYNKIDRIQMEMMDDELAREYDTDVKQYYSQGSYNPAPEPDDVIDEDGNIDREGVQEITRHMLPDEQYETSIEIADKAVEQKIQNLEDKYDVESADLEYEASYNSFYDETVASIEYENVHNDEVYEASKILVDTEDYLDRVDEFSELDAISEQQEYIEQIEQEFEDVTELEDKKALNTIKDICKNSIEAERLKAGITQEVMAEEILGSEDRGVELQINDDYVSLHIQNSIEEAKDFYDEHGVLDKLDGAKYTDETIQALEGDHDGRAFARNSTNSINLPEGTNTKTVVHEIGHLMHRNMSEDLEYAVNELFQKRTAGKEIKTIYSGKGEKAYVDAFESDYTGKVYNHEEFNKYGEEVLSMGMGEMYENPVEFRESDEEHFNLTYAALKGLF